MKRFERQEFVQFYDDSSSSVFEDLEFVRCSFQSSAISIALDPYLRSTVRNVRLISCEQRGCSLWPAVIEDVLVENLKTNGVFQTWGAVFKHVVLRGKIGKIMISPFVAPSQATPIQQRKFDEANSLYYADIDWAIDITEAEFEDFDVRRVPAALVRRDAATQVIVKRTNALNGAWRDLDLSKTHWRTAIELFLKDGDDDVVLVAGKRHKKFKDLLDGLKMLRDVGVADQN